MSIADGEAPSGGSNGPLGHLPWQQIPKFTPGTTNLDEYVKRLGFLRDLWPEEHLPLLAPRAALLIEGSAFQKVSRMDASKLRSAEGLRHIVEALGGQWGKSTTEEKYHFVEQALFQVCQRQDESNDSYIARHDYYFEEVLARSTKIEEIRAYILLRHSTLAPEDRKRVAVEPGGVLDYGNTIKALRLLGSRFFNDFQTRGSSSTTKQERNKVYDIHMTAEDEAPEEINYTTEEEDEALMVAYFAEQYDDDAIYVAEFEDHIIEALQESELAPVFSAYQEARARLREKARSRGYWPPSKGRGKGKYATGKKGQWAGGKSGGRPRSLAERIANSTCRLCGKPGHWKRECPRREEAKTEINNHAYAADIDAALPEILQVLPEDAMAIDVDSEVGEQAETLEEGGAVRREVINHSEELCFQVGSPKVVSRSSFAEILARRLLMSDRMTRCTSSTSATERRGTGTKEVPVSRATSCETELAFGRFR